MEKFFTVINIIIAVLMLLLYKVFSERKIYFSEKIAEAAIILSCFYVPAIIIAGTNTKDGLIVNIFLSIIITILAIFIRWNIKDGFSSTNSDKFTYYKRYMRNNMIILFILLAVHTALLII